MFLLVLLGLDPLIVGLPPLLGAAAARIGVLSHFESMVQSGPARTRVRSRTRIPVSGPGTVGVA